MKCLVQNIRKSYLRIKEETTSLWDTMLDFYYSTTIIKVKRVCSSCEIIQRGLDVQTPPRGRQCRQVAIPHGGGLHARYHGRTRDVEEAGKWNIYRHMK